MGARGKYQNSIGATRRPFESNDTPRKFGCAFATCRVFAVMIRNVISFVCGETYPLKQHVMVRTLGLRSII